MTVAIHEPLGESATAFFMRVDVERVKQTLADLEKMTMAETIPEDFVDLAEIDRVDRSILGRLTAWWPVATFWSLMEQANSSLNKCVLPDSSKLRQPTFKEII